MDGVGVCVRMQDEQVQQVLNIIGPWKVVMVVVLPQRKSSMSPPTLMNDTHRRRMRTSERTRGICVEVGVVVVFA